MGRATTNDLVINDLTASREQFGLQFENGTWFVLGTGSGVVIDGSSVREGDRHGPLSAVASLELGAVCLTICTGTAALVTRFTR